MSISQPEQRPAARSLAGRLRAHRNELVALLLLIAITGGTSTYVAWKMFSYDPYDYEYHVQTALEMKAQLSIELPHFLYHLYVILLSVILPGLNEYKLAVVSIVTLRMAAAGSVFWLLAHTVARPMSLKTALALAGGALMLVVVTPITVLTWWPEGQFYLGYVGMNVFHNPTMLALVPLALPAAWVATRITFSAPDRPGLGRDTAICALLIVLSTLAKPSYLLCLLPAVGLISLWRLARRERLPWRALILGIGLPGVILLAWQYVFTYGGAASDALSESSIEFAPFKVMVWLSNDHNISTLFMLSIVFPALVYVLFFPATLRDRFFTLSAVATVIGVCYAYLLAEGGARVGDGNFLWSAEITLYLWFVAAIRFLIVHNRPTLFGRDTWTRARTFVVLVVFGLHLVSGMVFELRGAPLNNGYTNLPSGGYYGDE